MKRAAAPPPMLPTMYNSYYQIVQWPGYVMVLVEMVHDARIIRLNDEHVPSAIKKWMGDSVGRWEGGELPFVAVDSSVYEYACHEGNYALPGILAAEREQEKAAAKGTASPNRFDSRSAARRRNPSPRSSAAARR